MSEYFQIQVALNVPLSTTFSYLTTQKLASGTRVCVPFHNRELCGVVFADDTSSVIDKSKLKLVSRVLDELPNLPTDYLALVKFCSNYYHYPIGQTLFSALPALLRRTKPVKIQDQRALQLSDSGITQADPPPRQRARNALWQMLKIQPINREQLRAINPQAAKWCSEWEALGYLKRVEPSLSGKTGDKPQLNMEQQAALDAVHFDEFNCYLLNGITGSGKTEVYLRLIENTLNQGKQSLILVPEINLTPQLLSRFQARFPATQLSILHSAIAENARFQAWYKAWMGQSGIIIGTRLAVFTAIKNLGLIIVDEEHDTSFKQQDELRYHARDMAIWRANLAKVPIILGSATPSLESVANVASGRYQQLLLTQRANLAASLPNLRLLDIKREPLQEGLSKIALEALISAVARKEQSLVYINRRGFSPVLSCNACGWLANCLHCSARLVLHLQQQKLRCHHCGHEEPVNFACPDCGNLDLQPLGQGTQRVEQALARLLPQARILRIDRDSVSGKHAWDEVSRQVHAGEVDILIGTQMLAKGHDFPNLSLVVILNADAGLYSADFRAAERLFAQLTQVAGRAGRADKAGEVLLQTAWAEHPLYRALQQHDVAGFAAAQLDERRELSLPPFKFQALLRAESETLNLALDFLRHARNLVVLPIGIEMFGPVNASMLRLAKRERAQLIVETSQRRALHSFIDAWLPELNLLQRAHRKVRWSLDIDPLEF